MQITYTQHALARMAERGISREEVEGTLAHPLRSLPAQQGRTEWHGWVQRAGKQQLLRVVTQGDLVVLVITVMAASKIEKYGALP